MADSELPEYSPRTSRPRPAQTNPYNCKHKVSLENSKGRAWVSLLVNSRAQNANHMPLFFDRDVISGEVQVNLDKAESIKGITVTMRAGTTAVGQDEELFLDDTRTLWTPTSSSKLMGTHAWPFSVSLPVDTVVTISPKTSPRLYALPPSFSERASPAYIDYKLFVTTPPSPLRTLAYCEGTPLPGPEADPDGWKVYPPILVTGTLFNTRSPEVQCTLAIATPFTYASNSPIPLLLTLKSADTQALDLLASKPSLELVRTVALGSGATDDAGPRRSNNTFTGTVARAVFFPQDNDSEMDERVLQGELHVPKGLKPSFTFPRLSLRYTLSFFPPRVAGFVPSTPTDEPMIAEHVTITLASAPGVLMRSYAPPGYSDETEIDYNIAAGFLENGNQRFLHHHG
ncbi:hypothetical protein EW146_g4933 [Bondarzewia mesenterica]|uniref:Arrestin-like N-terminal domain-containing protein n=1 Tax=Bondarzewia mesenterica TaxID=1095465 RepID=A0A4S4LU12_9AGAM|nr:hypothetical protein EW146_g4933 [Bondarzewia mesenterica]